MLTFRDFELSVELLEKAARDMRGRLRMIDEVRFLSPVVQSALQGAAARLSERAAEARFDDPPKDMIDEEWRVPAIRLLRASIATLELRSSQPPRDLGDWARDLGLAIEDFETAKQRFDRDVER